MGTKCANNDQNKTSGNSTCPLCRELKLTEETHMERILGRSAPERHLLSTAVATLIPDISPLVEGHLLLVTNRHTLSFASLSQSQIDAVSKLLEHIEQRMEPLYGPIAVLEHGSTLETRRYGACIDHAHLHILPQESKGLIEDISRHVDSLPTELSGLGELRSYSKVAYLMCMINRRPFLWRPRSETLSQLLRKVIWDRLRSTEHWDWALPSNPNTIERALEKLGFLYDQIDCTYQMRSET
jgi:diadenosine tetraphosphate (Ap4A) HIT family hydrolase